jgi:phosphoadenosine phosphosulfate reductase
MSENAINDSLIAELEKLEDPQELIGEVFRRFGDRAAIGTSGQLTGVTMIHMAVAAGVKPRVFTIDTLRLFPQTYELFDRIEEKYGIHVEGIRPDPERLNKMLDEHGEYLFFDSKEKQELCCHIRKVEPNERVLATLDVWLSGLRSDQSAARAGTKRFEVLLKGKEKRPLLKIAPLVHWTEKQLREFARENNVPIHELLQFNRKGWHYESLGCVICTSPIGPHEPRRAGRWRWFKEGDDKECGIHVENNEDEV